MFIQLKKSFQGQQPGARIDVAEADAKTILEAGIADPVHDDVLSPMIAKSMEGILASLTNSLNTTIDATLKEFAAAQSKSKKNGNPAIFGEGGNGDPKKTLGQFLLAVRAKDAKPTTLIRRPTASPGLSEQDSFFPKSTPGAVLMRLARLRVVALRRFDFLRLMLQKSRRDLADHPFRGDLHCDRLVDLAYRPLRIFPPVAPARLGLVPHRDRKSVV